MNEQVAVDRVFKLGRLGRASIIEKNRLYEDFSASEVWKPGG
jgi:hypothetical protein